MGQLRAAQQLFDAQATDNDGVASAVHVMGERQNLSLALRNDDADNDASVYVEVGFGALAAGRNAVGDLTDDDFYQLVDQSSLDPVQFTVGAGQSIALDISPVGAYYVRLKAQSAVDDSPAEVTAWASSLT